MKRQWLKNSSVMFVPIFFALMTGIALAEGNHWFVVKDKGGACRVIEAQTVAGPFKTMEEAEKRQAADCPKGAGQAPDQVLPPQEQTERMRRQHPQRDDSQRPEQMEKMRRQHMQREEPQHGQDTDKMKGKAPEKVQGAKPSGEKVKERTREPSPSDKKN